MKGYRSLKQIDAYHRRRGFPSSVPAVRRLFSEPYHPPQSYYLRSRLRLAPAGVAAGSFPL
jgi:hypothetical protein